MIPLTSPFTEPAVRALKVGDEVAISGTLFTGRDAVHKYLHEGGALPPEVKLRDGILYHCGPVVLSENGGWRVVAAGPTTSTREEPYQAEILKRYTVADSATWAQPVLSGQRVFVKDVSAISLWTLN